MVVICFRFLPTKRNISSWKLDKQIKRSLTKLIEKRKSNGNSKNKTMMATAMRLEEQEKGPKDLLGLMIQASSNSSSNITDYDIIEECKSFFFAGKQTTSNLLTWTTVLLAMHPHWQVLAREEVLRVCGSRDLPTRDDVAKLKTVSKKLYINYENPTLSPLDSCVKTKPPLVFVSFYLVRFLLHK